MQRQLFARIHSESDPIIGQVNYFASMFISEVKGHSHKTFRECFVMNQFPICSCILNEDGTLVAGGYLNFSFHQQWSKLCTLLQADVNDAEMKKKCKIFDNAPSYKTKF